MKFRTAILLLFLTFFQFSLQAKVAKQRVIEKEINKVYEAFELGYYHESLESLYIVLTLDTIIPDETAFLLGVAFSRLGREESSQVALLKYIRLTSDQGDYFQDCITELHRVNESLGMAEKTDAMICEALGPLNETMVCPTCLGEKKHVHECTRCKGAKQEVCQVCRGQGVIVRFSYYNEYSECYECRGKGYTECERCEGTGEEEQKCRQCKAKGIVPKPRECDYFSEKSEEEAVQPPSETPDTSEDEVEDKEKAEETDATPVDEPQEDLPAQELPQQQEEELQQEVE